MITRISRENADRYTLLFDKASAALGLTGEDKIASLNSYFANLNILKTGGRKTANETDEDFNKRKVLEQQQRIFLRLPLDEDVFEIDANTRTIKIPASFARNGVSVQSDELSEILYFVIDRYYDTADLAANDMNIAIQWQARNTKGQIIEGVTKNYSKDIESLPGKIIFGWPISSQLTAAAGNISFAIRFYTIQNNELVYSFSTTPATVAVKASLAYDLVNNANYNAIDYSDIIVNRITSNGIYDIGAPVPTAPVATALMILSELDVNDEINIPENSNEEFLLGVKAKPTDTSELSAKWKYYPAENAVVPASMSGIDLVGRVDYEAVVNYDPNAEFDYYIKDENDEYHRVIVDNADYYRYVSNSSPARFVLGESGIEEVELYVKRYICNINTENTGAGRYTVSFDACNGLNTLNFALEDLVSSNVDVTVPGPDTPEFEENQPSAHTILKNRQASVKIHLQNSSDALSYKWYSSNEINGTYTELTGLSVNKVSAKIASVETLNANDDETKNNQQVAFLIQNGANVVLYKDGDLQDKEIDSSTHKWVALDLDLHVDDATNYKINNETVDIDNRLEAGHVLYLIAYDDEDFNNNGIVNLEIKDSDNNAYETLHLTVSTNIPQEISYALAGDSSELTIYNGQTLDRYYKVDVTARRNKAENTESYQSFRITNTPVKPSLFYKAYENAVEKYFSEVQWSTRGYQIQIGNNVTKLCVAVKSSIQTDGLYCLWLKSKLDPLAPEYESLVDSYELDLPNNLVEQLGEIYTNRGYIIDNDNPAVDDVAITNFAQVTGDTFLSGEGLDTSNNTRYLEASINLNDLHLEDMRGAYYCIVVNKLNEHYTTTVGPMIRVTG